MTAPSPRRFLTTDASDPHEERLYGPTFPEYAWPEQGVLANVTSVRRGDVERALACDAGELAVLLVWIYYSSILLFTGAEFTHVYAKKYGSHREGAVNETGSHAAQSPRTRA